MWSSTNVSSLIRQRSSEKELTDSYPWHDSIHTRGMTLVYMLHDSIWSTGAQARHWQERGAVRETWLIRTCNMTQSCMWYGTIWWSTHSSVIRSRRVRKTRSIRTCDMAHTDVWHDAFLCGTWLPYVRDMTPYAWHANFFFVWYFALICVKWCVAWLVEDMTSHLCVCVCVCVCVYVWVCVMDSESSNSSLPVWNDAWRDLSRTWLMSSNWMSHGTCPVTEWVMTCHVLDKSRHMTHSVTGHVPFWYVTRILVCDVTLRSYHMPRAMRMTWFA